LTRKQWMGHPVLPGRSATSGAGRLPVQLQAADLGASAMATAEAWPAASTDHLGGGPDCLALRFFPLRPTRPEEVVYLGTLARATRHRPGHPQGQNPQRGSDLAPCGLCCGADPAITPAARPPAGSFLATGNLARRRHEGVAAGPAEPDTPGAAFGQTRRLAPATEGVWWPVAGRSLAKPSERLAPIGPPTTKRPRSPFAVAGRPRTSTAWRVAADPGDSRL